MKKYYKQGSSIFELDFNNQKMTCVTENVFNKGIVVSEGVSGPFIAMANSFSSSVSEGVRSGFGEPTLESTEAEFKTAFIYAYEMLTSASAQL
jgi:hypothetical protein